MHTATQTDAIGSYREISDQFDFELSVHAINHLYSSDFEAIENDSNSIQPELWSNQIDSDWKCIASDYSVCYKRMDKRYYPLHSNNMSFDLHRFSAVGACKVADITRCSYAMMEGQCIRVSVHAKLIFMQ